MKAVRNILLKDRYFYALLIFLAVFIGQLPIILHLFHAPKGYFYPFLNQISFSDYYYPALIRYGMGPDWLVKIPYVVSDHPASFIQILFVLLGKLSLLTGIGSFEMYAIFRVIGGVVFAVSGVLFLKIILEKNQARLAFVFFLLGQPLVWFSDAFFTRDFDAGKWVWHWGEAAKRVATLPPHYTLGKGLTILSLVFLILYLIHRHSDPTQRKKNLSRMTRYLLLSVFLIFIAGIIYPPPVLIVLFSLAVAGVMYLLLALISSRFSSFWPLPRRFFGLSIFALGCVLPLLILKAELAKGYPWDMWLKIELGWNKPMMNFERDYLRELGFLVVFTPFSLSKVFGKNNTNYLNYFIFFWFISAFLLFPFANVLSLSKFRLTEGAQIVPMSILALWGGNYLFKRLKSFLNFKTANLLRAAFLFLFMVNFLVITFRVAYNSTIHLWGLWRNVYFYPDELAALSFLSRNAKDDSVVLADTWPSNFIPAFTRVKTIIGFPDFYEKDSDFLDEQSKIMAILHGTLSEREALDYILKRKTDYIYYETLYYGEKTLYPNLLESVYKNQSFEIYKVKEKVKE